MTATLLDRVIDLLRNAEITPFFEHDRSALLAEYDALKAKQPAGEKLSPTEKRGLNLACWCKIGSPCHADVLLEIANVELAKERGKP